MKGSLIKVKSIGDNGTNTRQFVQGLRMKALSTTEGALLFTELQKRTISQGEFNEKIKKIEDSILNT